MALDIEHPRRPASFDYIRFRNGNRELYSKPVPKESKTYLLKAWQKLTFLVPHDQDVVFTPDKDFELTNGGMTATVSLGCLVLSN